MRHRKRSKRLGRQNSHRKATLKNMARELLQNESIKTTKVKARVAQSLVEKLITAAKVNTPESKRHVFAIIRDKAVIETLFNDLAPRFKSRNGGYTRLIPLYPRKGDGSPMAMLELVEKKSKVDTQKPVKAAKQQKQTNGRDALAVPEKPQIKKPKTAKVDEKEVERPEPKPKRELGKPDQHTKQKGEKDKKGGLFKNFRRYFGNRPE